MIKPKLQNRIEEVFEYLKESELEQAFNDVSVILLISKLIELVKNKKIKENLTESVDKCYKDIDKKTIQKYNKECIDVFKTIE
jgi:hypothetical protein